jgi:hypothetical protein
MLVAPAVNLLLFTSGAQYLFPVGFYSITGLVILSGLPISHILSLI